MFVYSVKLKLELSILSKLADLVRGNRAERSGTLNTIEDTTIEGRSASVMMEPGLGRVNNWYGKYGKDTESGAGRTSDERVGRGKALEPVAHDLNQSDTSDDMSHGGLQPMRSSARTSGRESDLMYAEFLASCK